MERRTGLDALPIDAPSTVVTVGFFDGVHVGHRAVLARTARAARERGVPSIAVTFDRHPREVLRPGSEPRLLTTVDRKAALIAEAEIDVLVVLRFTESFSRWPAEAFIERVLVDGLHAERCVVGGNFRFGHRAAGTVELLMRQGPSYGFTTEPVGLVELDGRAVSSSSIRQALAERDLAWPRAALGRRFALDGTVVPGAGRGRRLGFPTANLRTWPRLLLPGRGIYAGRAFVDGRWHPAAISVGTNPTFGAEPLHVEAFLLGFDGEIVGSEMAVEFWSFLRDEERFDSIEDLADAIEQDAARTREIVGRT